MIRPESEGEKLKKRPRTGKTGTKSETVSEGKRGGGCFLIEDLDFALPENPVSRSQKPRSDLLQQRPRIRFLPPSSSETDRAPVSLL